MTRMQTTLLDLNKLQRCTKNRHFPRGVERKREVMMTEISGDNNNFALYVFNLDE